MTSVGRNATMARWQGDLWRHPSLDAEAGYAELREPDF